MLQVSQAAMDHASGAAGNSGAEVVLLEDQSALAGAGTLARDGDSVDSAADDHHVKMLGFQRGSRLYS